MSRTPSGPASAVIGKKREKRRTSRMPSGLAMIANGPKKGNTKNVTHTVWSACGCHQQKKRKNRKCHEYHLVWPSLPMGQNFKEKQKISHLPFGLAVAVIGKNKEIQKSPRMPSGLAVIAMGQKKNKECHACHLVWPCMPEGKFF
jgi:hypothetical protein